MKKADLLAVLVVFFVIAGCSNGAQQVTPITAAANARTVSEVPGRQVPAPIPAIAERPTPDLLHAIAVALDHDKKGFCQYSQSADCDKDFRQAFHFRKVTLSESGQKGFIVEFSGAGFCGSAGCAINVLKQTGDKVQRTFENDEVGSLDSFEFAATVTNGFYDLTKHGSDGVDYHYAWTGSNYEDVEPPLSAVRARAVVASDPSRYNCKDCVTATPLGVPFSRTSATIR
jgi:hypothetical protein